MSNQNYASYLGGNFIDLKLKSIKHACVKHFVLKVLYTTGVLQ